MIDYIKAQQTHQFLAHKYFKEMQYHKVVGFKTDEERKDFIKKNKGYKKIKNFEISFIGLE